MPPYVILAALAGALATFLAVLGLGLRDESSTTADPSPAIQQASRRIARLSRDAGVRAPRPDDGSVPPR